MRRWYVAKHLPAMGPLARQQLGAQGFETFAPCQIERIVERGRVTESKQAIFAPYMFVAFDRDDLGTRWQRINNTRGVKRLLPLHCIEPLPMPIGCVEGWQERVSAGEFTEEVIIDSLLGYLPGDFVRVIDGTYAGHVGSFRHQQGRAVQLMMRVLGNSPVPVTVDIGMVQRPMRKQAMAVNVQT